MTKTGRARYTLEFKQEAVRLVEEARASRWLPGRWAWWSNRCSTGSRLSALMEREILEKATAYFAKAQS